MQVFKHHFFKWKFDVILATYDIFEKLINFVPVNNFNCWSVQIKTWALNYLSNHFTYSTLTISILSLGISNSTFKILPFSSWSLPLWIRDVWRVDTIWSPVWPQWPSIPISLVISTAPLNTWITQHSIQR